MATTLTRDAPYHCSIPPVGWQRPRPAATAHAQAHPTHPPIPTTPRHHYSLHSRAPLNLILCRLIHPQAASTQLHACMCRAVHHRRAPRGARLRPHMMAADKECTMQGSVPCQHLRILCLNQPQLLRYDLAQYSPLASQAQSSTVHGGLKAAQCTCCSAFLQTLYCCPQPITRRALKSLCICKHQCRAACCRALDRTKPCALPLRLRHPPGPHSGSTHTTLCCS